jgi:predicted nucleotidyltransferase component of viral defense system
MNEKIKNVAASVRQRLLNKARAENQDSQRLVVRYAIERLLYRLSQSPMRERFVLKGATLFALWSKQPFRSTGDLDLLGFGTNDIARLREEFVSLCRYPVQDDGLVFDPDSVQAEVMREEEEYQGARVRLDAKLGTARIAIQIDIGCGDSVYPKPQEIDYPRLLDDFPPANIRAYPPETVVAEKLEAMVRFGELTSRLKDHYDIWALAQTFSFSKTTLLTAIVGTFRRRGTELPSSMPVTLTSDFAARLDKQALWDGFLRRTTPTLTPQSLANMLTDLRGFIEPLISASGDDEDAADGNWTPHEGWK